jgi:hypothetical protein
MISINGDNGDVLVAMVNEARARIPGLRTDTQWVSFGCIGVLAADSDEPLALIDIRDGDLCLQGNQNIIEGRSVNPAWRRQSYDGVIQFEARLELANPNCTYQLTRLLRELNELRATTFPDEQNATP